MSTGVADAPARSASESTTVLPQPTTATARHSEALLVTCVLAEQCGPLSGVAMLPPDAVRDLVHRILTTHGHEHALAWAFRVDRHELRLRWRAGRALAIGLYPTLPGIEAVAAELIGSPFADLLVPR